MEENKSRTLKVLDLYTEYKKKAKELVQEIKTNMPEEIQWIINAEGDPFNTRMSDGIWDFLSKEIGVEEAYGLYYLKGKHFDEVNEIYENEDEFVSFKEKVAAFFSRYDIYAEVKRYLACDPGDRTLSIIFKIKE